MASVFLMIIVASLATTTHPTQPATTPSTQLTAARLTDPSQGTFHQQYYSLYLNDVKCGWSYDELSRADDIITGRSDMLLKISRGPAVITVTDRSVTTETVGGKPLTFSTRSVMGGLETVYQGFVRGQSVEMTITQAGQSATHRFAMSAGTLMPWGQYVQTMRRGLAPGTEYEITLFDAHLGPGQFVHGRVTIVGPDQVELGGKQVQATKVVCQFDRPFPTRDTVYVDEEGEVLITETHFGPFKLKLVAAEKGEAMGDIETSELFVQSFIKLARPLKIDAGKPIRYRITFTGSSSGRFSLPETTMQKIVGKGDRDVTLEVTPYPATVKTVSSRAATSRPSENYLADSTYLNLKDPLLVKLVKQQTDPGDTDLVKAQRLCQFVHEYITKKDLSVAFAPAGHVARTRQGDCTEHAVLLAALGRIAGIPTRVAIGLAHTASVSPNGAFAYHLWTQCFVDGRWIDLDPALGQVGPDAGHIALAVSDLTDEQFIADTMQLISLIGQIEIEQIDRPSAKD